MSESKYAAHSRFGIGMILGTRTIGAGTVVDVVFEDETVHSILASYLTPTTEEPNISGKRLKALAAAWRRHRDTRLQNAAPEPSEAIGEDSKQADLPAEETIEEEIEEETEVKD